MSEQAQEKSDLFADSPEPEVVTDTENSTASESSQKPNAGSLNRERQIKVWADRIEKGEATLDSIPDNMNWLKPLVEQDIDTRSKHSDIDARVKAQLALERAADKASAENKKAKDLKRELQTMDLSTSDKALMQTRYDRLRDKGLSDADALEEAMEEYKVLAKAGEEALNQKKKDMQIPLTNKNVDTEPEYGTDNWRKKGTAADRMKKMEEMLKAAGHR